MERIHREIKLSEIKESDMVWLCFTADSTGPRLYTRLFYSDGKVAQTDLVLDDPTSEIAKVEVPESLREEKKKRILEAMGELAERDPGYAEEHVNNAIRNYQIKTFIEHAITDGYLKEYITVFGRDLEQKPSNGLERKILENKNPLTIFGCRQADRYDKNVLAFSLEECKISFYGKYYEMIVPSVSTNPTTHIIVPNDNLVHIAIGANEILSQLMTYPSLKPLLDTGIIQ